MPTPAQWQSLRVQSSLADSTERLLAPLPPVPEANVEPLAQRQLQSDALKVGIGNEPDVARAEALAFSATELREGREKTATEVTAILLGVAAKLKGDFRWGLENMVKTGEAFQVAVAPLIPSIRDPWMKNPAANEQRAAAMTNWAKKIGLALDGKYSITTDEMGDLLYSKWLTTEAMKLDLLPNNKYARGALYVGAPLAAAMGGVVFGTVAGGVLLGVGTGFTMGALHTSEVERKQQGFEKGASVRDFMNLQADLIIDPMMLVPMHIPVGFGAKQLKPIMNTIGKPFRPVFQSHTAGVLYRWLMEPLDTLPRKVYEPLHDAMFRMQEVLEKVDKGALENLLAGRGVLPIITTPGKAVRSTPRVYRSLEEVRLSMAGGTVLNTELERVQAMKLGRHKAVEVRANAPDRKDLNRVVVGNKVYHTPLTEDELRPLLEPLVNEKGLQGQIKRKLAIGWSEADINSWLLRQEGIKLGTINDAWGQVKGIQGKVKTTPKGKLAKVDPVPIVKGDVLDRKFSAVAHGHLTLKSLTKEEKAMYLPISHHIKQLQVEAGLKPTGHLKDVFPSLMSEPYIPADVLRNVSPRTVRELQLPRARRKNVIGKVNPEELSLTDDLRDFTYFVRRKQAFDPWIAEHAVETKVFRTPGGKPVERLAPKSAHLKDLTPAQLAHLQSVHDVVVGRTPSALEKALDNDIKRQIKYMEESRWQGLRFAGRFARNLKLDSTQAIALQVQHNTIRALLGMKLDSALGNLFIGLNTATRQGVPEFIEGALSLGSKDLKKMFDASGTMRAWTQLFEGQIWERSVGQWFDEWILKGFNVSEGIGKAIAFNTSVEKGFRARGYAGVKGFLKKLEKDPSLASVKDEVMVEGRRAAVVETFLYGMLGRPPGQQNPFVRSATTLLSFSGKQANFLRRQMIEDPTSLLRYFMLSGYLIENTDQWLGVDSHMLVGLGFTPMTRSLDGVPVVQSPEMQTLWNLISGLGNAATGNGQKASQAFGRAYDGIAQVVGAPVAAIKDYGLIWEEWNQGTRPGPQGQAIDSSKEEAVRHLFFSQSSVDAERRNLAGESRRRDAIMDFQLNRRVKDYLKRSAEGGNGDDFIDSLGAALALPVIIDGKEYQPTADQLKSRIRSQIKEEVLDPDLLRFMDLPKTATALGIEDLEKLEKLKRRAGIKERGQ